MTFLEKYYEDHPGGQSWVAKCPSEFGYEKEINYDDCPFEGCEECWNRQLPKCYTWIASYTVRLVNGDKEDRVLTDIHAADIRMALASAQTRIGRMPKEDPEIEAAFVYDIGIVDEDYDF